jgi:CheY-like chemotaxis protein
MAVFVRKIDQSFALNDTPEQYLQKVARTLDEMCQVGRRPQMTTTGHGTGLGLSQVYGFVKQSGGHVKIYRKKDQGTTVKIYLSRLSGKGTETGDDGQEKTVSDGHQNETVLVVEDNLGVREYSAEILRDLGYTIIEAEDGPAALRQIERNEAVDLLFTDIGLPGMNGHELVEEALRRRPKLKVLYTTAYAKNAVVHHGRLGPGVQLETTHPRGSRYEDTYSDGRQRQIGTNAASAF